KFDAVICAFNSLNYVRDHEELRQVIACVCKHLNPGGLFLFDVTTHTGMQSSSGLYLHVQTRDGRFAVHFAYDREKRIQRATILFPSAVEIHKRIPIDPKDVMQACQNTGMVVESHFSDPLLPGWLFTGGFCFFVMNKA